MTAPPDAAAPTESDLDADRAAEARGFFEAANFPPPSVATAAPNLPPAVPAQIAPPPAPVAATPPTATFGALPGLDALEPSPPATTRGPSALRRGVSWVILLALLAGLVVAGVYFGPRLLELSKADTSDAPRLPLAYPIPISDPPPVRSAAFSLTRATPDGEAVRYDANVDFESGVSQVVVDRPSSPTLEIRAVFDDAVVRRVDQPTWYRTGRGAFPFDGAAAPDLIPTLDTLVPLRLRSTVTILDATEDTLGAVIADDDSATQVPAAMANEPLQRLRLEIPQAQLAMLADAPAPDAALDVDTATAAPAPDPALAPDAAAAASSGPAGEPAPPADSSPTAEPTPPAETAPAAESAPAVETGPQLIALPVGTPDLSELADGEPVTVDVWVDQTGTVRHLRTDDSLGSETLTIVSTSTEPWIPVFPEEAAVQPLTAEALLALGE